MQKIKRTEKRREGWRLLGRRRGLREGQAEGTLVGGDEDAKGTNTG